MAPAGVEKQGQSFRGAMRQRLWISALVVMLGSADAGAQNSRPDFTGMWSDPPSTAVDVFCFFVCTDVGIAYLNTLLDDPANDNRPYPELSGQATRYQRDQYLRPRLTTAALEAFPLDPADDPGFLRCEPWGFARQIFAPHQMEMRQKSHAHRFAESLLYSPRVGKWHGTSEPGYR